MDKYLSQLQRRSSEASKYPPGRLSVEKIKTHERRSSVGSLMSPIVEWPVKDFSENYECLKVLGKGAQGSVLSLRNKKFPATPLRPVVAKFYKEEKEVLESVTNEIAILKELNKDGCRPFLLCYQENFRCFGTDVPQVCGMNVANGQDIFLVVVYDYFLGKGTSSLQELIQSTILPDQYDMQVPTPTFNSGEREEQGEQDVQYVQYNEDEDDEESVDPDYLSDMLSDFLDESEEEEEDDDTLEIHLTADVVYKILSTLVRAVAYLHKRKVAHLDLKPDNVIINLHTNRVQLIDFGLSCMKLVCNPSGTLEYMAPEVAKIIGGRKKQMTLQEAMMADSWSIGVMLYQLVNKENPFKFTGDKLYFLGAKLKQDLIQDSNYEDLTVPDFSRKINNIINGFLRVSPKERLSTTRCKHLLQGSLL
jgi:serine/threonine protein kinase